ncbi:hypothetical protein BEWA_001080 [Theileria equi strain WA]|uniref:Signal peptide-containing protein n=1 Tax=Theileria equi strain WA TaxID=1537102 RepID=L0B0B0_THEEQ|nr:hypothetical protein BEWA_001080 [Theileria equi strain WA]AFZ80701.1 hypothetical protein BEWA_001080 [Theileria equi strain WA]|eukprot:XP_004830367.1 hypothetical protein BEWA_001080 [Theileria equi strain WA]
MYGKFIVFVSLAAFVKCLTVRDSSSLYSRAPLAFQYKYPNENGLGFLGRNHKYPHLLAFHSEDCDFCKDMDVVIDKVVKDCKVHIDKFYVSNEDHYRLFLKLDKRTKCGGLPFYYNMVTHRHICGATTYQNLRAWAENRDCSSTMPPNVKQEEIESHYRGTGIFARINRFIRQILLKGEEKMLKRLDK